MRLNIEIDSNGKQSLVRFENLKPGDVFVYENYVYMRISATNLYSNNAVRLDTGDTYIFDLDREVIRPEFFKKDRMK